MGVIYEGRLKEAIEARGIGFAATPAELDQLKKAGASAELLQLISSKAPGRQKPSTPPPPATGTLALQCAPVECVVSLNVSVKERRRTACSKSSTRLAR